jgi:hypothetical protein
MKTFIYICDHRTFTVTKEMPDETVVPDSIRCKCGAKLRRRPDLEDFDNQFKFKKEEK